MKKIDLEYRKNGYIHRQVYRAEGIAIYETISPESGRRLGYEVFEVIKISERLIWGKLISERESPPSNESWGINGFTVWTIKASFEKVDMLMARRDRRNLGDRMRFKAI